MDDSGFLLVLLGSDVCSEYKDVVVDADSRAGCTAGHKLRTRGECQIGNAVLPGGLVVELVEVVIKYGHLASISNSHS